MSNISHCDNVSPSHWRQHSSDEVDPTKMFEFFSLEVEPASIVHPLTQKLNRRLSTINLFLRHIQVVDKDNYLVATLFRPVLTFTSPGAHLAIDQSLHLVRHGLS